MCPKCRHLQPNNAVYVVSIIQRLKGPKYIITPIVRTLVVRTTNNPDRLDPSGNFVENSTKLICLEITGYRSSAVL
jgi:hypothetical protein